MVTDELEDIHRIALLHDIGKISTPIDILNKPGKLTDDEFAIMKQHAANGYEILKGITVMPNLALGAGYHHERIQAEQIRYTQGADRLTVGSFYYYS